MTAPALSSSTFNRANAGSKHPGRIIPVSTPPSPSPAPPRRAHYVDIVARSAMEGRRGRCHSRVGCRPRRDWLGASWLEGRDGLPPTCVFDRGRS